jgi:hypothetical protein
VTRLLRHAGELLEQRTSRSGFLVRTAVVGSALLVAPVRFLLRPQSALAAIVRPRDCAGGLCNDGWTDFCCTIDDGINACPPYAFVGGWWKCTDYRGRRLCADEGVRYYLDCNRLPGHAIPGGCRCAAGDCGRYRVGCNVFRYGQCNTQIPALTEVVCRVVVCEHPASIADFNCTGTYKQDNRTCAHEAPCLAGGREREFTW